MAKKRMATLPTTPAEPIDMQAAIDRVTPPDPHRKELAETLGEVRELLLTHRHIAEVDDADSMLAGLIRNLLPDESERSNG